MSKISTAVFICGAGPVGLLTGLGLALQGIDTYIVEKREREIQATYGRATTMYCRSMELLEQLGVADDMLQSGFVARSAVTMNNGKRVTGRGFDSLPQSMINTLHDYFLSIRQKFSEDIFREHYQTASSKDVHYGWGVENFTIEKLPEDDFNVTVHIKKTGNGEQRVVRWFLLSSNYLIGADGGQSSVRNLAGIPMEGDSTTYRWVRIDAKMKTNMPEASHMGVIAIESPNHGNVLWIRLDRDVHRIGFAMTPKLLAKYPNGITQDEAVQEAIESVKPYTLEVERVDWWTNYGINQRVAASFQKDEFILLAGDAAHVHSSGFAQGMNTGIHDATNLAWKLGGTIKGWYSTDVVLASYASERRPAAQKLIAIDKLASAAISHDVKAVGAPASAPEEGGASGAAVPTVSPDEMMAKIYQDNIRFNIGLGVSYPPSPGNPLTRAPLAGSVPAGTRAPDAVLRKPGCQIPLRLLDVFRAGGYGKWNLLVFAGNPIYTRENIASLREALFAEKGLASRLKHLLNLSTLIVGHVGGHWEAFNGPAVARLYFDTEGAAHDCYSVTQADGAIVVVRPDGILGFAAQLDELSEVEAFFDGFCA
ncbi:uncharacterized protein E0L32_007588 [Thyridium curvatum]|uniref:Uncharacterized protein n=1 Tax=Thyridium curvatum TaxID=1093900 RepID=A0A507B2T7_9PEZI|nr:uncharacterized protein E0L32_007588 [Thyridium curvatum]TPX11609.1 hypothetical protein E0L32_007588 [Thyridium curvatum]